MENSYEPKYFAVVFWDHSFGARYEIVQSENKRLAIFQSRLEADNAANLAQLKSSDMYKFMVVPVTIRGKFEKTTYEEITL